MQSAASIVKGIDMIKSVLALLFLGMIFGMVIDHALFDTGIYYTVARPFNWLGDATE